MGGGENGSQGTKMVSFVRVVGEGPRVPAFGLNNT